ncbi:MULTISPECIES: PRC-barrel domain-containing protein [Roseobacteraceae]|jgi:hypothetical protein|uniref:PRC-barrel domain protein n=1 Tax=Pseudosulfitobacter pseudonitzschiae TaxID=1402135 RepID=A0A221K3A8_9RHOB|nr:MULTISPECIES: PRC-barrel domain-containing protein [Roseobacteraceae]ASM73492.1 PRC-barrel domain protein [Pseudosulfitobacter pseudonitzschiae]
MKQFLATTAAAALLATSAFAQTQMQSPFVDSTVEAVSSAQTVRASDLIGKAVYVTQADVTTQEIDTDAIEWERVGDVNDLIMSPDGEVNAVLLDIGGFLGVGERSVALNIDQLNLVSGMSDRGEYYVVFKGTAETLENAPEYDTSVIGMWAEDSAATDNADATDSTMTTDTAATDPAATDMQADTEQAADADAAATDNTDTAATADMTADKDMKTGADMDASENNDTFTANPPTVAMDGWAQVEFDDLTAEDLTGAAVFDAQMEGIGEVGELYVSEDGKLTGALLDIGGFLGIGEDHVRVDMASLNIQRGNDGGEVRVYVDMTEDSLKAMQETK